MCQEIEAKVNIRGLTRVWKSVDKYYAENKIAYGPYFTTSFKKNGWAEHVKPHSEPMVAHYHTAGGHFVQSFRPDKQYPLMSRRGYHVFLTREACERWARCHGGHVVSAWIDSGNAYVFNSNMYAASRGFVESWGLLVETYTLEKPINEEDQKTAQRRNTKLRAILKIARKEVRDEQARDAAMANATATQYRRAIELEQG
jgi:hypothetical protein